MSALDRLEECMGVGITVQDGHRCTTMVREADLSKALAVIKAAQEYFRHHSNADYEYNFPSNIEEALADLTKGD